MIRDKQTIDLPVTITQSREPEIVAAEEKSEKPDLGARLALRLAREGPEPAISPRSSASTLRAAS